MAKIKITSNPYEREISYCSFDEVTGIWLSSDKVNTDGYLRAVEYKRSFLPFKIKEIIDLIVSEYGAAGEIIEIAFEGTSEEYDEVEKVCNSSEYAGKVSFPGGYLPGKCKIYFSGYERTFQKRSVNHKKDCIRRYCCLQGSLKNLRCLG